MSKRGKKYNKALEMVNQEMAYTVTEAVDLLEKTNTVKFDPTVEIHFNLGIDPKHADQMVRSTISLPNGSGKTSRICAFTDGSIEEAKAAGAALAGGVELIDDISKGNVDIDFDVCVATPTMMRHLGKIARVLGPKGLMPNPKAGTVSPKIEEAIKEIANGKFEFKNDKEGNVHSVIGKLGFGKEKLLENLTYFINLVNEIKPSGAKGVYMNSAFICNAMGPSIKLDLSTEDKK
ncbi:MAG: 50S ribosomal protein L1 [Candidatus Gracilibacteria bacterium]|nr:50S ribosomal protein L1 [Candidatus Gracilibacteria bacterium]MDQ7022731.1 50S ribosomal protein L1 [Candidatus Gracilibacteria bacterium]